MKQRRQLFIIGTQKKNNRHCTLQLKLSKYYNTDLTNHTKTSKKPPGQARYQKSWPDTKKSYKLSQINVDFVN